MLLHRSILSKVCILLAICLVKAQYEYDKEEKKKEVKEEEEDDRDYAKIFAEETSPALTAAIDDSDESPKQSDFVTPAEFETYFTPAHIFGESNEQPVKSSPQKKKKKEPLQTFESKREDFPSYLDDGPLKDFFEQSEKRQQKLIKEQSSKDEEVIPPGPSYISHQIPARYSYEDDEDDDKSTSASEDVESVPARKNKQKSNQEPDFEEGRVEKNDEDYSLPVPFTFESFKVNNKPKVDYNTGKSSSTVSQYPAASGYVKPAASTPYQKYSFQPAKAEQEEEEEEAGVESEVDDYSAQNSKFFDSIIETVNPYNPTYKKNTEPAYKKNAEPNYETQSTENAPSQLQGKGCRKIQSSDSDDMNCFICENPKTNAKYTQCSYSSQKKPVNYYEGNSAKYSMPNKQEQNSYRYKRYAENDENDPYTYIRNRARKSSTESGIPSDYGAGFQYEAEHYDESKPELTYSEQHSEDIKKNPENCQKIEKDGMTCTVCKDAKSGGNFEQCSYTSKPKEKKYAYVTEKKYENDEPVETQVVSQSKAAESNEKEKTDVASNKNTEFREEYKSRPNQENAPKKRNEEGREEYQAKSSEKTEKKDEDPYEYPSYFSKSLRSPHYDDSVIYKGSSSDNVDKKDKSGFADFDEYHFKYFPEFAKHESRLESKQESRQEPVEDKYDVPVPEATKQNVESVLAEFTKKDRSNCKKAEKKGMTCFLCVDKNNIQNEECMYVQESKPETKHVAYHEVKQTEKATHQATAPEQEKNKAEESKQESKLEPAVTETKNKYFFKNVPNPAPLLGLEVAASETVSTFVRYDPDRAKREVENEEEAVKEPKPDESAYDAERIDDKADPTIKTPEEFNVAPGEGAFSDETKAVYSKELGVQLPKYMLDKSEFEKEFDAFSGSF